MELMSDLCRELGISSATFYKWRSKYGRMDVSLMARQVRRHRGVPTVTEQARSHPDG